MASNSDLLLDVEFVLGKNAADQVKAALEQKLQNIKIGLDNNQLGRNTSATRSLSEVVAKQGKLAQSLRDTTLQTSAYTAATDAAGHAVEGFGRRLGFTTTRLAAYLVPATAIFQLSRGFNAATDSVIKLNAELNKLTQILDGNQKRAEQVATEVSKIATSYGQSTSNILKITNLLAQSGKQFGGNELTKAVESLSRTQILATFGSIEETTQGAIAAINQFGLAADDLNHVLDISNQLSKKFASEAGDLFTAVQSGGAAFAAAGGTLDEFAVFVTALRQLTRISASTIGTSFQTISLRLLRPDVLETLEKLTDGGIRDARGNLKGITDIMIEAGKASKDFDPEKFALLAETLFGIRQGKAGIPLLKDIGLGEEQSVTLQAFKEIEKAAGSTNRDATIALERIDVILGRVGANFQEAFLVIAKDPNFKALIKDLASIGNLLADILKVSAPLLPVLLKLGAISLGFTVARQIPSFLGGLRGLGLEKLSPQGVNEGALFNIGGKLYTASQLAKETRSVGKSLGLFPEKESKAKSEQILTRNDAIRALGVTGGGGGFVTPAEAKILLQSQFGTRLAGWSAIGQSLSQGVPTQQRSSLSRAGFRTTSNNLQTSMLDLVLRGLPIGLTIKDVVNNSVGFSKARGNLPVLLGGQAVDFRSTGGQLFPSKFAGLGSAVPSFRPGTGLSERGLLTGGFLLPNEAEKALANWKKEINREIVRLQGLGKSQAEINSAIKNDVRAYKYHSALLGQLNKEIAGEAQAAHRAAFVRREAARTGRTPGAAGGFVFGADIGGDLSGPRPRGPGFLSRTGEFAKTFGPLIGVSLVGIGLESLARQNDRSIKRIVDDQGDFLKNFDDILEKNLRASTRAGIQRGASTGGTLGFFAGLQAGATIGASGGPIGAIGGGLIGAGIGLFGGGVIGGTSANSEARRQSQLDRLAAASQQSDIAKSSVVIASFLKNSGFDKNPNLNSIGGNPFASTQPLINERIRQFIANSQAFLNTEEGVGLVQNFRQRAIESARSGRFSNRESVIQAVIGEFRSRLREQGVEGQGVDIFFEEAFKKFDTKILDPLIKGAQEVVASFNKVTLSVEKMLFDFERVTANINLSSQERSFRSNIRDQFTSQLFGSGDFFRTPDNTSSLLLGRIQRGIAELPPNVFGSRNSLFGIPNQEDRINSLLNSNLGNIISPQERSNLTDLLSISKTLQTSTFGLLSRISQQNISDFGEDGASGAQAARIVDTFFKTAGLSPTTDIGKRQLELIRSQAIEFATQGKDPVSAVSAAFKQFESLDPVLQRVNASFGEFNSILEESQKKYKEEQQVRKNFLDAFNQDVDLNISRIKGRGIFGDSSRQISNNLLSLEERVLGGNVLSTGFSLEKAQSNLRNLQNNPQATQEYLQQLANASLDVTKAQDRHQEALNISTQKLKIFQGALESLTNSIQDRIQGSQNLALTPIEERLDAQLGLRNLDRISNNPLISAVLKEANDASGIGLAIKEGRLTEEQVRAAQKSLSRFAGQDIFLEAIRGSQLFGTQASGFRNGQNRTGQASVLSFLAGQGITPEADVNTMFQDIRKQVEIFDSIRSIETSQLEALNFINHNIANLVGILGGSPFLPLSPTRSSPAPSTPTNFNLNAPPINRRALSVSSEVRLDDEHASINRLKEQVNASSLSVETMAELTKALDHMADVVSNARSVADIKFDANMNFSGFESVGRDAVTGAVAVGILQELQKLLQGGTVAEREVAIKLGRAIKVMEIK